MKVLSDPYEDRAPSVCLVLSSRVLACHIPGRAGSSAPPAIANDMCGTSDGQLLTRSGTSRHTASIQIILTLHLCAYACVSACKWRCIQMSECIGVCHCKACGRPRMIDSGVIFYLTVTSISKPEVTPHT